MAKNLITVEGVCLDWRPHLERLRHLLGCSEIPKVVFVGAGGSVDDHFFDFVDLMSEVGVSTIVGGTVSSAQALAFLAGGERLMVSGSALVYHMPDVTLPIRVALCLGADRAERLRAIADRYDALLRQLFKKTGVIQRDIDTMLEMPGSDVRFDAENALLAGIATKLIPALAHATAPAAP